jgi:hypothetical protein
MAFIYPSESITENFLLVSGVGESLQVYIYGAQWQSSSWLSDPTAALAAVNDAFDSIADLDFSGIVILSTITSQGVGMAFCVDRPIYKDKIYINPNEVSGFRAAIANALNTGDTGLYLTYTDIVLGASQRGI